MGINKIRNLDDGLGTPWFWQAKGTMNKVGSCFEREKKRTVKDWGNKPEKPGV